MTPRFDILTLHPDMVRPFFESSILGRAQRQGLLSVEVHNIRDHGLGPHRSVDDAPYGGGPGMVMRVDVVANAIEQVRGDTGHVIYLDPAGEPFKQSVAQSLVSYEHLVLLCGHYEGIDARILRLVDQSISMGDYVVTGGEIAACAVADAVARLHEGVLGNPQSSLDESFASGLLEYPQYTRPRLWREDEVPEVLLSGNHQRVAGWRQSAAEARTKEVRPDLWRDWCNADVDAEPSTE